MFADGVDLVDRSSTRDESFVQLLEVFEHDVRIQRQIDKRRASARNQEKDQRPAIALAEPIENGPARGEAGFVRNRVAPHKNLPSCKGPERGRRGHENAFNTKIGSYYARNRIGHGERGFPERDGNDFLELAQIDNRIAGADLRTIAGQLSVKRRGDVEGRKGLTEDTLRNFFHVLSMAAAPARAASKS